MLVAIAQIFLGLVGLSFMGAILLGILLGYGLKVGTEEVQNLTMGRRK